MKQLKTKKDNPTLMPVRIVLYYNTITHLFRRNITSLVQWALTCLLALLETEGKCQQCRKIYKDWCYSINTYVKVLWMIRFIILDIFNTASVGPISWVTQTVELLTTLTATCTYISVVQGTQHSDQGSLANSHSQLVVIIHTLSIKVPCDTRDTTKWLRLTPPSQARPVSCGRPYIIIVRHCTGDAIKDQAHLLILRPDQCCGRPYIENHSPPMCRRHNKMIKA